LVLAALVVAIKFHDDQYYNNQYYAMIGGVSLEELNYLEKEILGLTRFSLYVHPSHYFQYYEVLKENIKSSEEVKDVEDKGIKVNDKTMNSQTTVESMDMDGEGYNA